jgi:hypothetical protein
MTKVPSVLVLSLLTVLGATTSCSKESNAAGTGGTRLAMSMPIAQSVAQGESTKVTVSVERTGFADAVQVTFSNLPEGVRVEGDTIPAGESKKDFVLVAAPTAGIVAKQLVLVTAKGAGIPTTQTFELTVMAKK